MNFHQHSYKNANRSLTAIISILFSILGGLMLGLILGFSLFSSTNFYALMCFLALTLHVTENGTTVIILLPISLPLLLALIFAIIAMRSSGISRIVLASLILVLGLFLISFVALPFLLFLATACFG